MFKPAGHGAIRTFLAVLAIGVLAGMTLAAWAAAGAGAAKDAPPAQAARTLVVTDTAKLHLISNSGSSLHEAGLVSGTLSGSMRGNFNIGATVSGSFTFYTSGGSITGHGTASPHGSGVYESFAGSMVTTGGTGRYAHAHGHASMYGVFDRQTYALTVQTSGKLSY
jgi:hypothetical protein